MFEDNNQKRPLYIPYAGPALLETPLLNKGSAFTSEERSSFNLEGLLPQNIETIEEQAERAYRQFMAFGNDMDKHIYLRNIQDTNETLFYRLLTNHLTEMLPVIYTPTVGKACEEFSNIYRRARGLFISYPDKDRIDDMLQNATKQNVKVIVVTDGERILGLGDQGIGGMGIPIGKLSLYTACGGISPAYCLPVVLDVGTNNQQLLNDPFYMGWRHPRISGEEYDEFVDAFIQAVKRRWPEILLQFEDFAQGNATPLLNRYKDELCCFNDDIQGTAAVTLGSLIAACKASGAKLSEKRVAFLGAGSAGCGIAEQIVAQMKAEGLNDAEARGRVFMVDRFGLITDKIPNQLDFQRKLSQPLERIKEWPVGDNISLLEVMEHGRPDILIGVSGQPGLFTEEVVKTMHKHCSRPIIFPLSNPLPGGGDAGGSQPLDRRPGAGGHRQPVRAGGVQGQALRHRPVQQLLHLPGDRPWRHRLRRHPGDRRHADVRQPGAGGVLSPGERRGGLLAAGSGGYPSGVPLHRQDGGQDRHAAGQGSADPR